MPLIFQADKKMIKTEKKGGIYSLMDHFHEAINHNEMKLVDAFF